MLKKLLFVYAFLFSYSGAILHSIVPHHHHNSHKEATEHHHHDNEASHTHGDEHQESNDPEHGDSLYLLKHSSNADISASHASTEVAAKGKKAEYQIPIRVDFSVFRLVPLPKIFHPPSDDLLTRNPHYLFSALRAPPCSIA